MPPRLTRDGVFVNTRDNVLLLTQSRDSFPAMRDGWYKRLIEAIEADGRDYKTLSLAARCGPNYVQQMIKNKKVPGTDKFVRLLNVLGHDTSLRVIMDIDATPEYQDLMTFVGHLDPEAQRAALDFFRSLPQAPAQKPKRPA